MNDDTVLDVVKDGMDGVHMSTPLNDIVATGRSRRRRRLSALTLAAGLIIAGGVITLQPEEAPVASGRPLHVRLAAFTVDTNPDGSVSVTLTKREALDPKILERTLAEAGVPSIIRVGEFCEAEDRPDGIDQVLTEEKRANGEIGMVINPAAMPAGAKLSVGLDIINPNGKSGGMFTLIPDDAALTCASDFSGT